MRVTRLEWAALAVTAAALCAMVFYYLGASSPAAPVTVSAREAEMTQTVSQGTGETAGSESDVFPIDLNTATVAQLMLLPSIGEVRAQAIVDYREEHGPFTYVEDLRNVKGIGEGTLEEIMAYATVSGGE